MENRDNYNQEKVDIELRRIDLCDLMFACSMCSYITSNITKWDKLHDNLSDMLEKFDSENFEKFFND